MTTRRTLMTARAPIAAVVCLCLIGLAFVAGPPLLRRMSGSFAQLGLGAFAFGYEYNVEFAHTAGLKSGSQVRIAGIRKGIVRDITLDGQHVVAEVVLDSDFGLGTQTTATIKMASVLGQQYIALEPRGPGRMEHGDTIPLERTQVPYTLSELATDATTTLGKVDTEQLSRLLTTMTGTLEHTPEVNKLALQQVMRLAEGTAARNAEIQTLLEQTQQATELVNGERDALFGLMSHADVIIQSLHERRELIHQLVVDTHDMAQQVNRLIAANQKRINPTMRRLEQVLETLTTNKRQLTTLLHRLSVAGRYFNNISATGPYVNTYQPYSFNPDQALCIMGLAGTCR